jgi:predicted nucleic acid-binding protein
MLLRELIVDASSLINLMRSTITNEALGSIDPSAGITPAVRRECSEKEATEQWLSPLLAAKLLDEIDANITADELLAFMEEHNLGAGESEGILTCLAIGRHFWADDRRARNVAGALLTQERVIGTVGILRALAVLGMIAAQRAFDEYQSMKAAGGFLPNLEPDYFERAEAQ